jgi:signal transduction histidine kinase
MRWTDFIRDHWIYLSFVCLTAGFGALLLYMVRAEAYFVCFVPAVFLLGSLTALATEFLRKCRFYGQVLDTLDALEEKSLLTELLPTPMDTEEAIFCDVLQITDKYVNDTLAAKKIQSADYREYIELWVHEIKTPIAAARLILENHQSEAARRALDELDNVEAFVQQVLFYTRAGHVEKDYIMKETLLCEIIEGLIKKNARRLIANHVSVEIHHLNLSVVCDTKWVEFILQQILDNSIKYKTDSARIVFSAEEKESNVLLSVWDNGIGISEKDIGRIFEKGFTGENGRRQKKSTGMGLYLCRKLCDKMGLGIAAESIEGTRITLIFPKWNPIGETHETTNLTKL